MSRPQYTQAKQSDHRLVCYSLYIGWPSRDGGGMQYIRSRCVAHEGAAQAEEGARRVRCARSSIKRQGETSGLLDSWITVGATCIPQKTAMSRRALPSCGLGGVIGGHQGACWSLLSGSGLIMYIYFMYLYHVSIPCIYIMHLYDLLTIY